MGFVFCPGFRRDFFLFPRGQGIQRKDVKERKGARWAPGGPIFPADFFYCVIACQSVSVVCQSTGGLVTSSPTVLGFQIPMGRDRIPGFEMQI